MMEFIWGIFTAFLGSLGFSLLFRVDLKDIPWGVLGGGLDWAAYLLVFGACESVFVSALAGAMAATAFAEIMACARKTPATVYLLPGLIPLVPGGSLYYTMNALIQKNYDVALEKGLATVEVMLGVSLGVVAVSLMVYAIRDAANKKRKT